MKTMLSKHQQDHFKRKWMKLLKRELQQNKVIRERKLIPLLDPNRLSK